MQTLSSEFFQQSPLIYIYIYNYHSICSLLLCSHAVVKVTGDSQETTRVLQRVPTCTVWLPAHQPGLQRQVRVSSA